MESFLWACNLCAVVYLCLWAIREDKRQIEEEREEKEQEQDK